MTRFAVALCLVSVLGSAPAYGIEGHYRVSEFGNGNQIWFEANFYDERVPDEDQFYQVVEKEGAFFNDAVTRSNNTGGYLRFDFDLSTTGGAGGTWYFWGREINPSNSSDYMLVEGDPGDDFIPIDEDPIPGGNGAFPFDNGEEVLDTLSKNVEKTKKILTELIDKIPKTRSCSCAKALEEAVF